MWECLTHSTVSDPRQGSISRPVGLELDTCNSRYSLKMLNISEGNFTEII